MKKIKNGFTLVELAIVLVVIGLLLGMAFKGKSLIDAARIKTDIYKVEKIETALNTYYAKYNTIPGKDSKTGKITEASIYDDLIKDGMLKTSDYKMNTLKTYYHLVPCEDTTTPGGESHQGKPGDRYWNVDKSIPFSENINICVATVNMDPRQPLDIENWSKVRQPSQMICYFETLLDDQNVYAGDGRRLSRIDTEPEVKDCAKAEKNDLANPDLKYAYFYKIF